VGNVADVSETESVSVFRVECIGRIRFCVLIGACKNGGGMWVNAPSGPIDNGTGNCARRETVVPRATECTKISTPTGVFKR
jgi:hypothetical protein